MPEVSTELKTQDGKPAEDWMSKKWRPMMGWVYMITCSMDFILFPVLWSILQAASNGQVTSQWNPITLQGAGLYHLAMGAVLGVAAWSRGQEKMAGMNAGMNMGGMNSMGGMGMSSPGMSRPFSPPLNTSYSGSSQSSGFASRPQAKLPDTDMEDADAHIHRKV
jgi:hypothetical protein